MGLKRTDEFRQDAVRIALTSGLTRQQGRYDWPDWHPSTRRRLAPSAQFLHRKLPAGQWMNDKHVERLCQRVELKVPMKHPRKRRL